MANIVIATAGHIDHGKTTLINALTGIETDTTQEEKTRGMSINLGFAYLDLPNGNRVGIIDVPGHEKFIKNMVSGLPGIDIALLVIDSGEGIMPQTREHISILHLLGVKNFIIVMTKINAVDPELKDLITEDVRIQLSETNLKNAIMVETDAIAGVGLQELVDVIQKMSINIESKNIKSPTRLNVDRVFSIKGFGTIVTGTLIDGSLSIGDSLTILPQKLKTKIRNIQIHENNVNTAFAGSRTALNLANIGVDDIQRGDVLTNDLSIKPSWMLDVQCEVLAHSNHTIQLWNRYRVLIGTKEVMTRVVTLGTEQIKSGENGFLQLRLEEQLAVKKGDRFILRTYSPIYTIGGGLVLDANAQKHKRFNQKLLHSLSTKFIGSNTQLILDYLSGNQSTFSTNEEISQHLHLDEQLVYAELEQLIDNKQIINFGNLYINIAKYDDLANMVLSMLAEYHKTFPLRQGMLREELRSKLKKSMTIKEIDLILNHMLKINQIKSLDLVCAVNDFQVVFTGKQQEAKNKLEKILLDGGYTPPTIIEINDLLGRNVDTNEILNALEGKTILRISAENVIHINIYQDALKKLKEFITTHGAITLGEFRDITNSSRKYSMLILEYIDKQQITKRIDNKRILNE